MRASYGLPELDRTLWLSRSHLLTGWQHHAIVERDGSVGIQYAGGENTSIWYPQNHNQLGILLVSEGSGGAQGGKKVKFERLRVLASLAVVGQPTLHNYLRNMENVESS